MEREKMLSVKEVTETLNISRNTVIRWIAEGRIKALKFGRQWRFRPSDISQWLEHGEAVKPKKKRYSLQGLTSGSTFTDADIDEARKAWERQISQ